MKAKQRTRIVWIVLGGLLLVAGIADAVRYLQPAKDPRIPVSTVVSKPVPDADRLIIIYNANGGIFPGIADVVWKETSPKTYPCNLCLHAFGGFGPKKEWKDYLESLPYDSEAYHKDAAKRNFALDGPFPSVLLASDSAATIVLTASQINTANSLADLIALMNGALPIASPGNR